QENLPDAIVDFVRAGVEKVLAFKVDLCSTEFAGEPFGKVKRRGSSAEFFQVILELALELRVSLRAGVFLLQLLQRMHECLRHEAPAVGAKMTGGIGQVN